MWHWIVIQSRSTTDVILNQCDAYRSCCWGRRSLFPFSLEFIFSSENTLSQHVHADVSYFSLCIVTLELFWINHMSSSAQWLLVSDIPQFHQLLVHKHGSSRCLCKYNSCLLSVFLTQNGIFEAKPTGQFSSLQHPQTDFIWIFEMLLVSVLLFCRRAVFYFSAFVNSCPWKQVLDLLLDLANLRWISFCVLPVAALDVRSKWYSQSACTMSQQFFFWPFSFRRCIQFHPVKLSCTFGFCMWIQFKSHISIINFVQCVISILAL